MKLALLLLIAVADLALGQLARPQITSVRSQSGQFIVLVPKTASGKSPDRSANTNRNFIQLEPSVLTVSCERIKQILYRELGTSSPWRGRIYLSLYPAAEDSTITLTAEHFRDGWQYRLELPDPIERSRYLRATVQTLLLEMANRTAGERSAELPAWLIEGLAQQLLASSELQIFVPPPQAGTGNSLSLATMDFKGRKENPLERAHQQLCATSPLTFEQLSWPPDDPYAGSGETYSASAQLLVHELLHLKDGPACFQTMFAQLPQYYNWQLAFLDGFHQWFQGTRDVEKWWALHVLAFTGRELAQTWPLEESFQKLDQVIHAGVQLRTSTNDLPLHTQVSLQKIIREWDRPHQTQALQEKVHELALLRLRVPQEVLVLVEDYREAIETYLKEIDKQGFGLFKRAAQNRATEQVLAQLDELDGRRLALRPAPEPREISSLKLQQSDKLQIPSQRLTPK